MFRRAPRSTALPPPAVAALAVAFPLVLGACSDEADEASPRSVVGAWFYCESARDPNCLLLDDDGFELAGDGSVRALEDTGQGSLAECGGSACFAATDAVVEAERGAELGTWVYGRGTLTLVVDGCAERLRPRTDRPLVAFGGCPAPIDDAATDRDEVRVRRFPGRVRYTNP